MVERVRRHRLAFRAPAALLPLVVLLTALCLTGCVRLRATIAVSSDDHVSGELIVAALPGRDDDPGPQLNVPPTLASRVRAQPYVIDGYTGSQLFFNGLAFDELRQLAGSASTSTSRYQLTLRRAGSVVALTGFVDLTQVPKDKTDVQVKMSFPAHVTSTDGNNDGDTVTWSPKPGQVTQLNAMVRYDDAGMGSWFGWAVLVAIGAGSVATFVAVLALVLHRRGVAAERARGPVRYT